MFDSIRKLGFKEVSRRDAKTQSYFELLFWDRGQLARIIFYGSAELHSAKILKIGKYYLKTILGTPHSCAGNNDSSINKKLNFWKDVKKKILTQRHRVEALGKSYSNHGNICANLRNLWIEISSWEHRHLAGNTSSELSYILPTIDSREPRIQMRAQLNSEKKILRKVKR